MKKDLVSVIMPCYNAEAYISQAIESVVNQSFKDWELIIVDDGSTDRSALIAEEWAQKDSRLTLVRKANGGSASARNEGIRLAKGNYLSFIDSDDLWHEDFLSVMLENIKKCSDERTAVFFSGYRRMDSACERPVLQDYSCEGLKTLKDLLFHCPIFPSASIVDLSVLNTGVFFREELGSLRDDYVFWLDILSLGFLCRGFSDVLVDYRMREDRLTSSKLKMIKPQWNVYRKYLKLGFFKSVKYLFFWALNGIKKYGYI